MATSYCNNDESGAAFYRTCLTTHLTKYSGFKGCRGAWPSVYSAQEPQTLQTPTFWRRADVPRRKPFALCDTLSHVHMSRYASVNDLALLKARTPNVATSHPTPILRPATPNGIGYIRAPVPASPSTFRTPLAAGRAIEMPRGLPAYDGAAGKASAQLQLSRRIVTTTGVPSSTTLRQGNVFYMHKARIQGPEAHSHYGKSIYGS